MTTATARPLPAGRHLVWDGSPERAARRSPASSRAGVADLHFPAWTGRRRPVLISRLTGPG